MERYNLAKLVKVTVNNFYPSYWFEYRTERKIFGIVFRKEGIYGQVYDNYIGLNCPKNHTLINGRVMENPEVVLRYQDKVEKTYYFETYDQAKEFADKITSGKNWIS